MKDISIIIPAYNAAHTIERAVKSLISDISDEQAEKLELIIVENGSTDNTSEVLDSIKATYTVDIEVYHSEKGVSHARNLGIEKSTGKWIVFLDADDYFLPNMIYKLLEDSENYETDLYIYSHESGEKKLIKKEVKEYYIGPEEIEKCRIIMLCNPTMYMTVWGKLFKREIIVDKKINFDIEMKFAEDSDFSLCYSLFCNQISISKDVVYHYSIDTNSVTRTYNKNMIDGYILALSKTKENVYNESLAVQNAYSRYIMINFNVMMVHGVFNSSNTLSFHGKLKEMKRLIGTKLFRNSINQIKLSQCFSFRMMAILFIKIRFNECAGILYYLRNVQNTHRR